MQFRICVSRLTQDYYYYYYHTVKVADVGDTQSKSMLPMPLGAKQAIKIDINQMP